MGLEPGSTFAGYRIIRTLGAGGMGEVYLARHPRLPREDAIKVLPPHLASDDDFRRRFLREADLAAGLNHPNIVGVLDRGEDGGRMWLSMPFVDGTDAEALLQRHAAGLPVPRVVALIRDAAAALGFAHERGVLHRDVKPANLLVADDRALLADFGIARLADDDSDLTRTGTTIGSVAYASPEQLRGETVDGRADVYSLAATAYTLLTGTRAFARSNPAAVVAAVLEGAAAPAAQHRPDLPGAVSTVLARGMARDRNERPATAGEFAAALATAADGAGPVTTGPSGRAPVPAAPPTSAPTAPPATGATVGAWDATVHATPAPVPGGRRRVGLVAAAVGAVAVVAAGTVAVVLLTRGDTAKSTEDAATADTAEAAGPATATVTAAPSTVTVGPAATSAPPTRASRAAPARPPEDLGLAQPITVPDCDGSAAVFITASVGTTREVAAAEISAALAKYPGSEYLTGTLGCSSLRPTSNGKTFYQVFMPYPTAAAACAAKPAFLDKPASPDEPYVRVLTNDPSVPIGDNPCD